MSNCSMRYMAAVLIWGRRPMVKMTGKQRIIPYTTSLNMQHWTYLRHYTARQGILSANLRQQWRQKQDGQRNIWFWSWRCLQMISSHEWLHCGTCWIAYTRRNLFCILTQIWPSSFLSSSDHNGRISLSDVLFKTFLLTRVHYRTYFQLPYPSIKDRSIGDKVPSCNIRSWSLVAQETAYSPCYLSTRTCWLRI